ncbi:MAG: GIY-YIG nuclease family protein [Deltaproteobacteria bacterium]
MERNQWPGSSGIRNIGTTSDLTSRLEAHNEGRSTHTAKYKPWKLVAYIAFSNRNKALGFEKYLKSGSGRAFAKKHFWENSYS